MKLPARSPLCLLGLALLLFGLGSASPVQAADVSYGNFDNVDLTLAAGDTLTVGSGTGNRMWVSYGGSTTPAVTVDARLATAVTIDVGELRVGGRSDPTSTTSTTTVNGQLWLGVSNDITASNLVHIGGGGHIVTGVLTTADDGTTFIRTPAMNVGVAMRTSTPVPNLTIGSNASLTIEGLSGGRSALVVGQEGQGSESINWSSSGQVDLSAGRASLKLNSLVIGNTPLPSSGEVGFANGTLTMSTDPANSLDVNGPGNVIRIGISAKTNTDSRNSTTGSMTVGHLGSSSSITSTDNSTAILIGNATGTTVRPVTGTLNLNGGTVTITTTGAAIAGGNMTSNLTLAGGVALKAGAISSNWIHSLTTATLGTGGATIDTNGFVIGVSQAFSGAGGLTKAGAGRLTLSGTNSYTGTTSVDAGVLEVAAGGSLSNSSGLTLNGGTLRYNSATTYAGSFTPTAGTIGGTNLEGSFGGLSIGSGLTLSPGNSPGTASTDSQTWAGGGTYLWEINSLAGSPGFDPGWDLLAGSDSLTVSATSGSKFTIAITSLDLANDPGSLFDFDDETSYAWKIADFANPVSGFDSDAFLIDTNGFANAFTGSFGVALGTSVAGGDATEVYVTYAAVPEPATFGLVAVAGAAFVALLRRRQV